MRRIATHVGMIAVCALAAAMLMMAAGEPAAAQRRQTPATPRPGWLPYYNSAIGGNLSAAEKAAATRVLEEFQRILLQVPELASPKGFEVMPQFWGGSRMRGPGKTENPNNVVEYSLRLYLFAPTQKIALDGCVCISVTVNQIVNGSEDEQGREIHVEPWQRGHPMPLATQVYGELLPRYDQALAGFNSSWVTVIMTSGGEPYFKTVTREEYYRFRIFQTEGKGGETLAGTRRSLEKTAYQQWVEDAEQRRRGQEAALKAAARNQPPEEVAKLRRTFEETERQTAETFKAQEADERERNKQALAQFASVGDAMRGELESMTPAERNMPAIIDPTRSDGLNATNMTIADRDSLAMHRVLTPNYDFWRARKSPVEVRSITVYLGSATGKNKEDREAVHNALLQTFKKLDWAALNKLLDVPR